MAETRAVDFRAESGQAVRQINAWVKAATNNLIDSIFDGTLPAETDVVVANAVYFKGKWKTPFGEAATTTDKFHRVDGAAVDARFMPSRSSQYIACHDGFKVLQLPYEQGHRPSPSPRPPPRFSMCVFLPDSPDGLWDLVDETASSPGLLHARLPRAKVPVGDFRLPKFKLCFSDDITRVLHGLGLEVTRGGGDGGVDFSGMVEGDGSGRTVSLGSVIHKAVIEVNEEGTVAAAVTATIILGAARPEGPPAAAVDFVADHPFAFFVIEDVSGAIVFAGHVLEPST